MLTESQKKRARELVREIEKHRLEKNIAPYLRELMAILGLKKNNELANKLGVAGHTVYRWMKNMNPMQVATVMSLYHLIDGKPTLKLLTFPENTKIPRAYLEALLEEDEAQVWMLDSLLKTAQKIGDLGIEFTKEQATQIIRSGKKK